MAVGQAEGEVYSGCGPCMGTRHFFSFNLAIWVGDFHALYALVLCLVSGKSIWMHWFMPIGKRGLG